VITVAPGGVEAEAWSAALRPDEGPALFAPEILREEGDRSDSGGLLALLSSRAYLAPVIAHTRGRAPLVPPDQFTAFLRRFAELAAVMGDDVLEEFEINPLRVTRGRMTALDALGRLRDDPEPPSEEPWALPARDLGVLFHPEAIAVAGVSAKGMNPARVIVRNVLRAGRPAARVQIVKEGVDEIDGVTCVPTVAALDPPVDVLVLGVPAADVPAMVDEAVVTGRARSLILISGGMEEGFAPGEPTPADEVRRALGVAPPHGAAPLVVGSNCLGIRSVPGRYDTLFIPSWKLGFPDREPAPLALISQSGAFAIARASALPELNPRYIVTLGTQMDVTVGEVLEYLLDDPELRTAACYVEGFRAGDGARFLRATRAWREAGRSVLLYRAGRSEAGRSAAASHTAALAGDYAVTRDLAGAAGAVVADTVEAFQDQLMLAASLEGRRRGSGLGAMSNAGFECVALGDHAGALTLADFAPATVERMRTVLAASRLDGVVEARNPLDVTPIMPDDGFADAARAMLEDPEVDVGVVSCVPLTPALQTLPAGDGHPEGMPGGLVQGLLELWETTDKAWVVAIDAGPSYEPMRRILRAGGVPVFPTADRAVAALATWVAGRSS
jgi:acyl-CoA synthetase (NDP forming)